jgi:hypothetical protein
MIDDRSVPFVVLIVAVIVAILGRPAVRSSKIRRRRRLPPGPAAIERLAETLGIGIIVQSIDEGPPATIEASLLLDALVHHATATGQTEDAAWEDLARQATDWGNNDPRKVRTYLGGF